MPVEILMPALSPTMKEGKLTKWCKKEGDSIESGEVLAEIETDKATMEFESVEDGIIGKIIVKEGADCVAVNSLIAIILEEGETKEDLKKYEKLSAENDKNYAIKEPTKNVEAIKEDCKLDQKTDKTHVKQSEENQKYKERVIATPLAKKIASANGIDLKGKCGSGPRGRIVKDDVVNLTKKSFTNTTEHIFYTPQNDSESTCTEPSGIRKTIAKRLVDAKQQIPHFYLSVDCILDDLLELRAKINQKTEEKITINDLIVKASALSIKKSPQMLNSWQEDKIVQNKNVDISVAVAIEDGLITPIVKNVDIKAVSQISCEVKDLAKRAKEGKLLLEEFQGGCFTISNLGMHGVKEFSAIINPPQSAILAVGAGRRTPIAVEDEIKIKTVMTVTLSCDHRIIDGAVGAQFLKDFKNFLQNPLLIFV